MNRNIIKISLERTHMQVKPESDNRQEEELETDHLILVSFPSICVMEKGYFRFSLSVITI